MGMRADTGVLHRSVSENKTKLTSNLSPENTAADVPTLCVHVHILSSFEIKGFLLDHSLLEMLECNAWLVGK